MTILYRIWAFLAFILFGLTLLIVMIPVGISLLWKEPARSKILYVTFKVWMKTYLPLIGVRVKVKGLAYFKPNQGYIITTNHRSFLDIMVTVPYIPGPSKTLAKVEMAKIPFFGLIYRAGSVLVDRKSEKSRRESLFKMGEVLNRGQHLCLYPEGTRNKTDLPLQPFYKGAFTTALQTQKPIIPCVLLGTSDILPATKPLLLKPGTVQMHFLPPIEVSAYADMDKNELKELVFKQMWEYIEEHQS